MPGLRPPPTHAQPHHSVHILPMITLQMSHISIVQRLVVLFICLWGNVFVYKKNGNNLERRKGTNLAVLLLDTKNRGDDWREFILQAPMHQTSMKISEFYSDSYILFCVALCPRWVHCTLKDHGRINNEAQFLLHGFLPVQDTYDQLL